MKKLLISLTSAALALSSFTVLNSNAYNKYSARDYARKYYYNYDPDGGDCTNFVSQCLEAGGYKQDKEGTNFLKAGLNQNWEKTKWYHKKGKTKLGGDTWDVSTTWAKVTTDRPSLYNGLYQYLTSVKGNSASVYGLSNTSYKNMVAAASVGDIIQLEALSNGKEHSLIVSQINKEAGELYVTSHSDSYKDKPFSKIMQERLDGEKNYAHAHLIKVR
ncbi:MAG: hypothetical protein GX638_01075 [Crenarchaeota archaeon]|nr:hypothetical protein [Thermoproteota archaeon]